ncbi:hypothetical protein ACHAP5_007058 [Fusarium lateritium]
MPQQIPPRSHGNKDITSEQEGSVWDNTPFYHYMPSGNSFVPEPPSFQRVAQMAASNRQPGFEQGHESLMGQNSYDIKRRRPSIVKRYKTRANCPGRSAVHKTSITADRVQSSKTIVQGTNEPRRIAKCITA